MAQPASSNFFLDNDDLRFQLGLVDWDTLVDLQEQMFLDDDRFTNGADGRAFYQDILTALGEYIAKEIAPWEHELDSQHPTFKDGDVTDTPRMQTILKGLADLGAMSITLPRRLGGMNTPIMVQNVLFEMMTRADASVTGQFGFFGGIAGALQLYSSDEGSVTFVIRDARWARRPSSARRRSAAARGTAPRPPAPRGRPRAACPAPPRRG